MRYGLSRVQAGHARALARLFVTVAVVTLVATIAAALLQGLTVHCRPEGCTGATDIGATLPDEAKRTIESSPAARSAFAAYANQPLVALLLGAITVLNVTPFAILMLFAGLALRQLGALRADALAAALPCLRSASFAAMAMAVVKPLTASLTAMLLLPGTPLGRMFWIEVDFVALGQQLLLAAALFAVVWAIDAGSRAARDIADFV